MRYVNLKSKRKTNQNEIEKEIETPRLDNVMRNRREL